MSDEEVTTCQITRDCKYFRVLNHDAFNNDKELNNALKAVFDGKNCPVITTVSTNKGAGYIISSESVDKDEIEEIFTGYLDESEG